MTDNLKNCPFCGGKPILQEQEPHNHLMKINGMPIMPDYPGSWTIECCDVGMIKDTREEVIAAWNRRTEPAGSAEPSKAAIINRALVEAHDIAMRMALEARIPECGDFASIAQNLAWVLGEMSTQSTHQPNVSIKAGESDMPTLPKSILNLIGEYGMARTDGANELEIQHRWLSLIDGIKGYARDVLAAKGGR